MVERDTRAAWAVEGSAGRSTIAAEEVDAASRAHWEATADEYQVEHGAFLAERHRVVETDRPSNQTDSSVAGPRTGEGFVWGPEGLTEAVAGLLGPVEDLVRRRVLEVGCGAAQCSQWLAARGVSAIGIDISVPQLRHAASLVTSAAPTSPAGSRRVSADRVRSDPTGSALGPSEPDAIRSAPQGRAPGPASEAGRPVGASAAVGAGRGRLHVRAATATALPFPDDTFDAAFASYGAIQFVGDLPRLLGEVRRVLRPGGRWVFSVTHPIRWAFPDDPGPAGLSVSGSYFDRTPYVERDASGAAVYAEFHRTIGDYVSALLGAGFVLDSIVEPEWPDWNDATWGGWSPQRGTHLPGTLIFGCRADAGLTPPD